MNDNIQDEFQSFKDGLRALGIEVTKITKVGNGSMEFYEVHYKSPRYTEPKSVYVHRQKLDELLAQFREAYKK